MRVYQTNEIKNIALIGAKGSGKTTLAESMLYEAGVIKRRGTIESKNTVSDFMPVELNLGYSVFPTVFHAEWNNKKLNIIDCPGSDDFVGGAITALNVTDQAVILINGQYGPEVGTQNNFRYTEKLKKPVIFLINQLDSEKCDFDNLILQMQEIYGNKCVQIQYPLETGPNFHSLIDVLIMKKLSWGPDGGEPKREDIPAEEMEKAGELHRALVEAAAENDDTLMEKFFEDENSLTEDELRIRKGLINRDMFPIFCVDAHKDMGVQRLMEFLGNVVPFVSDMPAYRDTRGDEVPADTNGPESLYFFKTSMEPHIGEVSYFKVMSGKVKAGDDLTNADRGSKERIGQIYACAGSNRIPVDELEAGDIGCTVKLKDVKTGNTLDGKDFDNVKFDFVKFPRPKYSRAIKAKNPQEMEKMMAALLKMRQEDPTWVVEQSKELRQTIVHGQGEFHLRVLKWRMENNEKLQVEYEEPRVPYRETITKKAQESYRHKKQSGGAGQFGEVALIVEPYAEGMPDPVSYKFGGQEFKMNIKSKEEKDLPWGGKLQFINSVVGGAIDLRFMPAILKGVMDCMERGPLTGSYARDVRVVVYDGKMHPVDSNELSFTLAARHAFSEAFKTAGPKILEPIYDLEVYVPSDFMGDVMSDLQGRRAIIMGMDAEAGYQKLTAKIPLKELANYSVALSSLTGGRASFNAKFASYELVPNDIQGKLIAAHEAEQKDEE